MSLQELKISFKDFANTNGVKINQTNFIEFQKQHLLNGGEISGLSF